MPSAVRWLLPAVVSAPHAPMRAGADQRMEVLEAMRREGLLVHVVAGVYLPSDVAISTLARAMALAAIVPPGGVVGLMTAAWLHGAPVGLDPNDVGLQRVDVLVPHTAGPRPTIEGVREHRTTIPSDDVVVLGGLRLTTPARTAADLARLDDDSALAPLRWLLDGRVSEWEVMRVLRTNQRYRNNRRARAVMRSIRAERSRVP